MTIEFMFHLLFISRKMVITIYMRENSIYTFLKIFRNSGKPIGRGYNLLVLIMNQDPMILVLGDLTKE